MGPCPSTGHFHAITCFFLVHVPFFWLQFHISCIGAFIARMFTSRPHQVSSKTSCLRACPRTRGRSPPPATSTSKAPAPEESRRFALQLDVPHTLISPYGMLLPSLGDASHKQDAKVEFKFDHHLAVIPTTPSLTLLVQAGRQADLSLGMSSQLLLTPPCSISLAIPSLAPRCAALSRDEIRAGPSHCT
jgi:hypothetical protein